MGKKLFQPISAERIDAVADRMRPVHVEVLRAAADGADYETICERTGLKEGTMKSRLNRARIAYREAVQVDQIETALASEAAP